MANVFKRWKGAVEPASTSPSGNQFFRWKGAVEPAVTGGVPPVVGNTLTRVLILPLVRPLTQTLLGGLFT